MSNDFLLRADFGVHLALADSRSISRITLTVRATVGCFCGNLTGSPDSLPEQDPHPNEGATSSRKTNLRKRATGDGHANQI